MTYFESWLTIISLVMATLALGYFLNRFALNRRQPVACTARSGRSHAPQRSLR